MQKSQAPKCPKCGKSVYFAERQLFEGVDYHSSCVWQIAKEREASRGPPVFALHEQIFCNPNDPKPWTGSGQPPAGHTGGGAAGGGAFCTGCGTAAKPGAKFCGSCGNKIA
eukprot:TRINITY_DN4231_c0_g1_i1.p1 TRINITY_DN4231_c0_g1~~TRINITY_DN4231_c0_g1_i1.p1  ORF type:complete len:111 (-),score=20.90 TRINITY_DN4231_c0_g1_i1:58-390(-)